MMRLGDAQALYLGGSAVQAVCLGADQVWPASVEPALPWVLELTAAGYNGPALSGSLPAIVDGAYEFPSGRPAIGGSLALGADRYVVAAVRINAQEDAEQVIFLSGRWDSWWSPETFNLFQNGWADTPSLTAFPNGSREEAWPGGNVNTSTRGWMVMEAWTADGRGYFQMSHNATLTEGERALHMSSPYPAPLQPGTLFYIGGDEHTPGPPMSLAALGVVDGVLSEQDRAAARAWAADRIPE